MDKFAEMHNDHLDPDNFNEDIDKDYIFQLFDRDGNYLDQTSLDENNPTLALYLFMDEFGWREKLTDVSGAYVTLVEFDDPDLYDDPNNFELSSAVRSDARKLCMADPKNKTDLAELESCPNYERDLDAMSSNHYCTYCWANGDYSVCELKPKVIIDS